MGAGQPWDVNREPEGRREAEAPAPLRAGGRDNGPPPTDALNRRFFFRGTGFLFLGVICICLVIDVDNILNAHSP
jgi:hypothetical protein